MIETLFNLNVVYVLTGLVLFVFAAMTFTDKTNPRRFGSGFFWLLLGVIFAFGSWMPYWLTGLLVVAMVALDGLGRVKGGSDYTRVTGGQDVRGPGGRNVRAPAPFGNQIFVPVIAIPVVTFFFAILFRQLGMDANRGALVGLGFGGVAAMVIAWD
jgi:uncharacterized membrane protein